MFISVSVKPRVKMEDIVMLRHSPRLLANGYYNPDDHTRQISYRENRTRRSNRVDRASRNLMNELDRSEIRQNQTNQETQTQEADLMPRRFRRPIRHYQPRRWAIFLKEIFHLIIFILILDAFLWFCSLFITSVFPNWKIVSPYTLSQHQATLLRELNSLKQSIAKQKLAYEKEIDFLKRTRLKQEDVEETVRRALSRHHADYIGMADYALESIGATVIDSSETHKTKHCKLFGFTTWCKNNGPETAIQPEVYPGKCWPFKGSQGHLVISLPYPVPITHVTLEHLPRVLAPKGDIGSAPRQFAVYGMMSKEDKGKPLGRFIYDPDGEPVQTFKLLNFSSEVYRMVRLRIFSNWGHPEYTCVYRFRVHSHDNVELT